MIFPAGTFLKTVTVIQYGRLIDGLQFMNEFFRFRVRVSISGDNYTYIGILLSQIFDFCTDSIFFIGLQKKE